MSEPVYEVVWPLGKSTFRKRPLAARIPDLNGMTVGTLWNQLFKGDVLFSEIKKLLQKRFSGIKFVDPSLFGDIHGKDEASVVAALSENLRKHGCDAVLSAVGA